MMLSTTVCNSSTSIYFINPCSRPPRKISNRVHCSPPYRTPIPFSSSSPFAKSNDGKFLHSITSCVGSNPFATDLDKFRNQKTTFIFNVICLMTAGSAACLFFAAIPTLLSVKKAAQSLERFLNTAQEELPDTMAAIRLSGMEISDLTMELSDFGQDITRGIRNSTRSVRMVHEKLKRLRSTRRTRALIQEVPHQSRRVEQPGIAKTARRLREVVMKGRTAADALLSVARFPNWIKNYISAS